MDSIRAEKCQLPDLLLFLQIGHPSLFGKHIYAHYHICILGTLFPLLNILVFLLQVLRYWATKTTIILFYLESLSLAIIGLR